MRFFLVFISLIIYYGSYAQEDIFEQIALQKTHKVPGLQENLPPVLPEIGLEWDKQTGEGFVPGQKIATQEDLDEELKRMRKKYSQFLKNFAPPLPEVRKQQEIETFEWRLVSLEMGTDEHGNLFPLKSMVDIFPEEWTEVTIPHYTGPINKAEAIYRKTLNVNEELFGSELVFLHFNAIDYSAEIYINNKYVGSHVGLFGEFEFNIKPYIKQGENFLEIKVFNDAPMMGDPFFLGPDRKFGKKLTGSAGPGWDEPGYAKGWTMSPAGFGIWQRCYLEGRAGAYINDLFIRPHLDQSNIEVWIELPEDIRKSNVYYSLYGQNFELILSEHQSAENYFEEAQSGLAGFVWRKFIVQIPYDQLRIWSLDEPWLYQLQLKIMQNGKVADAIKQQFGMRSFVQSESSSPKGRFYLNGNEIMLQGANTMGNLMQCVIRNDYQQLIDDILLAKIAGMNFWRLTQQPCQPEVYDYFDMLGLLAQTDMSSFNGYRKDAVEDAVNQFREMMRLIRNHPCNAVISYCNEPDFSKPVMLDRSGHEKLFFIFDSIAAKYNPGQVTKWIDGDYLNISQKYSDHHSYDIWYGNSIRNKYFGHWYPTRAGWMHACGEFGAEGLDRIELMNKYYPEQWLFIGSDSTWSPSQIPRCQTESIGAKWLNISSGTMQNWVDESRKYQKSAIRLMTETLRRDPKMNSFAVHLLIDAWPAGWLKSIMDTDRKAKPAYFAYRDALRPVAVNLRPNAFYGFAGDSINVAMFICNDTPDSVNGAKLHFQIEMEGRMLNTGQCSAVVPGSTAHFQGHLRVPLPLVENKKMITLRAGLFDKDGKSIHESSFDIEVYPMKMKNSNLTHPGGYWQRLIN